MPPMWGIPQSPLPSPTIPSAAEYHLQQERKLSGALQYPSLPCLSGPAQWLIASTWQSNFELGNVTESQCGGWSQLKWSKGCICYYIYWYSWKKQTNKQNPDTRIAFQLKLRFCVYCKSVHTLFAVKRQRYCVYEDGYHINFIIIFNIWKSWVIHTSILTSFLLFFLICLHLHRQDSYKYKTHS